MEALKVNMTRRELCLENTMINHFGVEELAVTLRQNTVLRKLSLIGNNIGLDGTQALVNAARAGAIEELHLFELRPFEYHQTDPNQALAEILVGSFSQSELDLHFCCITDEVTQALAMALQYNQTLVHLRLDLNKIRVAGAKALATALSENRCVQILNLAGNALGDAGAQAIAEALERNRTLVELVLNKNNIGQQGTEALCSAMMTNSSLKKLALVGNDWGDIGLQARGWQHSAGRTKLWSHQTPTLVAKHWEDSKLQALAIQRQCLSVTFCSPYWKGAPPGVGEVSVPLVPGGVVPLRAATEGTSPGLGAFSRRQL